MWPVSSRWIPALSKSHGITLRVEAWLGDAMTGLVDVADGTVTATARNRVRRTLNLTVPETLFPSESDDLLAPYGTELRVYQGLDYGAETELIPVFRGRLDKVVNQRFGGSCDVACSDLFATVNDARFEIPRGGTSGAPIWTSIRDYIVEAIPAAGFINHLPSDSYVPAGMLWDRDRGQAIDDLATSIGAETWADPGGTFHLAKPATLDQAAVWTLADGVDGTLVSDSRSVSRDGVYSLVVVIMERADGSAPILVTVEDTDPTSPTYVGGPFGRVPRFYRSPLVTSEAQAREAGAALLARSTSLTRTRQVTCVPNPALEIGDRIDITVGGVLEQHLVDSFTLPLGPGEMSITTRSAKPDPGDT